MSGDDYRGIARCLSSAPPHSRSLTESMVESVVTSMSFWPDDLGLFSTTGCKRVAQKVDVVYEAAMDREEEEGANTGGR